MSLVEGCPGKVEITTNAQSVLVSFVAREAQRFHAKTNVEPNAVLLNRKDIEVFHQNLIRLCGLRVIFASGVKAPIVGKLDEDVLKERT